MSGSTSYLALRQKYRDFGAPTVRIHVDGVEITEKKNARLSEVSVDLTAEYAASGCGFDIVCEYEPVNTAFSTRGAMSFLQLGAKVELELGYIETVTVFSGLIVEIEEMFDGESSPYIHIECMDAKCLLMKRQRLGVFGGKGVGDLIGEIIDTRPFRDYIGGKKIEPAVEKLEMLPAAGEDDYRFTERLARRTGYEFFIAQGTVYFRKPPASSSSIMTIGPGKGLISLKQSLRGVALYKKTLVVGINPADDQIVRGEAALSGKFGDGSSPSRMVGDSEKALFDHRVTSAEQAQGRARALMQSAQGEFGRMECRCVGIPELVPGRNVTVEGISPEADKAYYILSVRHTIDGRGFFTNLEARIHSL
ncbi:MAG: hypothetical protein LBU86_00955 [Oscillospiraceae bacterium]|jgi:phage protein D|nr:hypothetical protein [Oscillospiraceae bacterium]